MNSKLHKSWKVWALAAVFLAAVLLAALYFSFKPAASEGSKQISLEVIGREGDSSSWEVRTDGTGHGGDGGSFLFRKPD